MNFDIFEQKKVNLVCCLQSSSSVWKGLGELQQHSYFIVSSWLKEFHGENGNWHFKVNHKYITSYELINYSNIYGGEWSAEQTLALCLLPCIKETALIFSNFVQRYTLFWNHENRTLYVSDHHSEKAQWKFLKKEALCEKVMYTVMIWIDLSSLCKLIRISRSPIFIEVDISSLIRYYRHITLSSCTMYNA